MFIINIKICGFYLLKSYKIIQLLFQSFTFIFSDQIASKYYHSLMLFFKSFLNKLDYGSMKRNLPMIGLFVFVLMVCGNAMRVMESQLQGHLTASQEHKAMKLVHMRLYSAIHLADPVSSDPDMQGPFGDFFKWLMADKTISKSIVAGTPLSAKSANKIKAYLKKHPQVIESFLPQSPEQGDDFSRCINKFNAKQKKKFYGIFLQEMDFKNMFVENGGFGQNGDAQISKASKKIIADKELGPIFTACLAEKPK